LSYDWNDLRHFLAVARAGSTLAASRELGVSQTTVARRLEALEHALVAKLFERLPGGYRLTRQGRAALELAERVEREAQAFAALFPTVGRRLSGPVKVTSNDILAQAFVAPALTRLRRTHPDIAVELIVSDRRLDLVRGEADLALRAGSIPDEATLAGQKLPHMAWAVYCSAAYAAQHGAPASAGDLAGHAVVLGSAVAATIPPVMWLEREAQAAGQVTRGSSLAGMTGSLKAGMGLSMLPRALGDTDPDLVLCFAPDVVFDENIWLTYPTGLRGEPRVRRIVEAIAAQFRETREGAPAQPSRALKE